MQEVTLGLTPKQKLEDTKRWKALLEKGNARTPKEDKEFEHLTRKYSIATWSM